MVLAVRDLFHGAPGYNGVGLSLGDAGLRRGTLEFVVLFDEQPVGLGVGAAGAAMHADERPLALQLSAMKDELERAFAQAVIDIGVSRLRFPGALVPQHDGAPTVLPLGDDSFKAAIFHGMVFDLHGQPLIRDNIAGSLGNGPGFEHAIPAEAKIIVKVGRGMLLYAKRVLGTALVSHPRFAGI